MQQVKNSLDIKQLGTILSFWAHPDDETFSCAGIMAAAVQNGQRVVCVTATRGEEGVRDPSRWPPQSLAKIRTLELEKALKILGVTEHFFLPYRDGACDKVPLEEGIEKVLEFVYDCQPQTILTFGPEGMTGHTDHQTVSKWVEGAIRRLDKPPRVFHAVELREHYEKFMKEADKKYNIYFNIDKPPIRNSKQCDICFNCTDEICAKKCAALAAQVSQTEEMIKSTSQKTLHEMFRCECFVEAGKQH